MYFDSSSVIVSGNTVTGNSASEGGGLKCLGGTASVVDNTVASNSSGRYGSNSGDCGGVSFAAASANVMNNTFVGNTAGWNGGAVGCINGSLALVSNTFDANSCQMDGGAVYIMAIYGTSPNITGNTFVGNSAGYEAGAIMCDEEVSPIITANTFDSNSTGDHGGAIAMHDYSAAVIANNLFVHNHTDGPNVAGGGAIQSYDAEAPTIANNTFVENWVGTGTWPNIAPSAYGGAVHVRLSAVKLINNIFYGNRADRGSSVACTESGIANISCCDAWPASGAAYHYYDFYNAPSYLPPGLDSQTCVYLNPGFYGSSLYWLQPGSPVRAIGRNPVQDPSVPTVDTDGRPRPGPDGYTDLGAYENNPACL